MNYTYFIPSILLYEDWNVRKAIIHIWNFYELTKGIKMYRSSICLVILVLLSACNLPGMDDNPTMQLTTLPEITITPSLIYEQCGWVWATQSLPDLSSRVQTAFLAAGLTNNTVLAEAYGENCISQNNKILSFTAMETDFHITAQVEDLTDTDHLGYLLEQFLMILDDFPPDATPGSQAGYIGIHFSDGTEEFNLWFSVIDGETARALGLQGSDLFIELQNR
jgi:hypothetical protein